MKTLFKRACAMLLVASAGGAVAQGFALEGAVIDSRSGANLGVVSERGDVNSLFRAQKAMTFGILRAAGISLEQLPSDVRARIERFATTNLEAFRAFSQGLDLKDQGKFVEAKVLFRRAAELDPGFALATEQQQAMPDVNLGTSVQTRAVIVAAAGAAVDRGKASFAVDTARALAALAAGQTVVAVALANNAEPATAVDYSTNPPGSSSQLQPNLVAGISYAVTLASGTQVHIANAAEWKGDSYAVAGGVLQSLGGAGSFQARLANGSNVPGGNAVLADGSTAYWGRWLSTPTASATVTVSGVKQSAPELGAVDYVHSNATRQMPGSGTAVFTPSGGSLTQTSGQIAVNFVAQSVELRNLGFRIDGLIFSGLNGNTTYDPRAVASGTFGGNYTSGTCTGCSGFTPQGSSYNGSFVGRNADGLVFSTILLTGAGGTASGVHLFKQP